MEVGGGEEPRMEVAFAGGDVEVIDGTLTGELTGLTAAEGKRRSAW